MVDIINHDTPDDFVVATGRTHSVRELCEVVFGYLNMDYKNYVEQDAKFIRAQELKYLRGDPSKTKEAFGWEPEYTFESMMQEMVEHWQDFYGKQSV
jgi:GDPmannose 4,6-dehydratase